MAQYKHPTLVQKFLHLDPKLSFNILGYISNTSKSNENSIYTFGMHITITYNSNGVLINTIWLP